MTFLDGAVLLAYIGSDRARDRRAGLILPVACGPQSWTLARRARFHHLAQSLIPIAGCGVFLGLSAITVTMLRAEGLALAFIGPLRALLLGGAALWTIVLGWRIAGLSERRFCAGARQPSRLLCAASIGVASWVLLFWVWQ